MQQSFRWHAMRLWVDSIMQGSVLLYHHSFRIHTKRVQLALS